MIQREFDFPENQLVHPPRHDPFVHFSGAQLQADGSEQAQWELARRAHNRAIKRRLRKLLEEEQQRQNRLEAEAQRAA